ncbi:MAG: flippase [Actinomycetota bacterium]|nr:flippase [Actinomycetota bacterium]
MSVLKRNIIYLLFSQVATWMATMFLLILAPRRLGGEGFGRVQVAIAFVGFFNLIGSLGTYQHIVKHVARDSATLPRLVVSAIRLKLLSGVVLSVLALLVGAALGYDQEQLQLIAIGCAGMVLSLLNEMMLAGLNGQERMAKAAVWQTVQVYVASILGAVVLFTTQSLTAYMATFSVAWAIPLVANFRSLRPSLVGAAGRHPGTWRGIILGGVPIFALSALSLLYSTIDIPIVEAISGAEVVGWYSLAYRWVSIPIFITTIVCTAFLPRMSALATTAPDEFARLTNRALMMVLAVNIPASAGVIVVSGDLVDLLYGQDFENSVLLMQLLAPFVPLVAVNTVLGTALVASDRHKRYIWVAATAAVINPPLTILAVRYADGRYDGNGAIGAAIVTVCTEIFITICALRMRRRGVFDRSTLVFVARCLIAAGAMVVVVLLIDGSGLFVRVLVGGVVYGVASLAVGVVPPAEAKSFVASARARFLGGGKDEPPADPDSIAETDSTHSTSVGES